MTITIQINVEIAGEPTREDVRQFIEQLLPYHHKVESRGGVIVYVRGSVELNWDCVQVKL